MCMYVCVCEILVQPVATESKMAIFQIKVKITKSLPLMLTKKVSLAEYASQI